MNDVAQFLTLQIQTNGTLDLTKMGVHDAIVTDFFSHFFASGFSHDLYLF